MAHCGTCPAFQPEPCAGPAEKRGDEVDQELGGLAEDPEEWPLDENDANIPQLEGPDAECFEVLNQMRAREKADQVEWADIANGSADMTDEDDHLFLCAWDAKHSHRWRRRTERLGVSLTMPF